VKKKFFTTSKDKQDWTNFTKKMGHVRPKDEDFIEPVIDNSRIFKIDLHGYSINEANKVAKEFVIKSFNNSVKKILIITGKGSRSKSYKNPYVSEELSILKNSVPEYLENDANLSDKIIRISRATKEDGGEGSIYIFLKNKKKSKE
jgi:DNA-nicking Smr family endonuclease